MSKNRKPDRLIFKGNPVTAGEAAEVLLRRLQITLEEDVPRGGSSPFRKLCEDLGYEEARYAYWGASYILQNLGEQKDQVLMRRLARFLSECRTLRAFFNAEIRSAAVDALAKHASADTFHSIFCFHLLAKLQHVFSCDKLLSLGKIRKAQPILWLDAANEARFPVPQLVQLARETVESAEGDRRISLATRIERNATTWAQTRDAAEGTALLTAFRKKWWNRVSIIARKDQTTIKPHEQTRKSPLEVVSKSRDVLEEKYS